MSLYGNVDNDANVPLFAVMQVGGNVASATERTKLFNNNTINVYGTNRCEGMYGVSAAKVQVRGNTASPNYSPQAAAVPHAGWVLRKLKTGGIKSISVNNAGQGINSNGFLTIVQSNYVGGNTGGFDANIAYFIGNTQNTMENYSTNCYMNGIVSLVIANAGWGYTNTARVLYFGSNTFGSSSTFIVTMTEKCGVVQMETLVAAGSITGSSSNTVFPSL